jgi:hypothetical protein
MISRRVCVIAAVTSFSVNTAIVQAPIGRAFEGTEQASLNSEQETAATRNPDPRQPPRRDAVFDGGDRPDCGFERTELLTSKTDEPDNPANV